MDPDHFSVDRNDRDNYMNFQSFEKTDRKILAVSILVLFMSSFLLWQRDWIYFLTQPQRATTESIGEISNVKNDVRRRHETSFTWSPMSKKSEVYQGDSIFTGADSSALVKTSSGEEISIAPNSLVVVNQKKDTLSLNIGFGSVQGRVEKGKKLLISSNNSMTELNGENAIVKVDAGEGNKIVLNVLAGEVRLRTKDGEKVLRQDDISEISPTGHIDDHHKPNIRLLGPLAGQRFKGREDAPILFTWSAPKRFNRMRIKIGLDDAFEETLVNSPVDDDTYSAYNLPYDREIFWQIIAEGGRSRVQKFVIVGHHKPTPIHPKPGHQFFYQIVPGEITLGGQVELFWENLSPTEQYEVHLAQDPKFELITRKFKTRKKQILVGSLPKGHYYWRVRSLDFPNEPWGPHSHFKVGPAPSQMLAAPVPLMTDSRFILKTKDHNKSADEIRSMRPPEAKKLIVAHPRFQWSMVHEAQLYRLQISRNRNFTDLVVNKELSGLNFVWTSVRPGQYYWRAKATNSDYKDGLFSPPQEIKVAMAAPSSLTGETLIDEVPEIELLKAPPPPLFLRWQPTLFSTHYEVQFSQTSDFSKSLRFVTQKSERQIQIQKDGIYYWRVRSLDEKLLPLSSFSKAYSLHVQRVYKDPQKTQNLMALYPKQQDSLILVGKSKPQIDFQWTQPRPDLTYTLELSQDPSFSTIFYSTQTQLTHHTYKNPLPTQVIYWRVKAEGRDFKTDWTGANRFLVSYEDQTFDFEKSDIMFFARLRAKERQEKLIALQKMREDQNRSPASIQRQRPHSPQILSAPPLFVIESDVQKNSASPRAPFIFRWQRIPDAVQYKIEISRDKNFSSIATLVKTENPFYVWENTLPGRYYYRVQSLDERHVGSAYSQVHELTAVVAPPVITNSDHYIEMYDEPKEMWPPPSPFVLSWTPTVFTKSYEIQFSEDRDHKISKVFKTSDTRMELRVSKPGRYFWRIRPLNERGAAIGHYSETRLLEIIQDNRSPASQKALAGIFPAGRTLLFVGNGVLNLPFIWTPSSSETSYQVEISRSPKFDLILARATSNDKKVVIKKELPEGRLFWRVRTRAQSSSVHEFILKRELAAPLSDVKAGRH